jgi:hypothetical protein
LRLNDSTDHQSCVCCFHFKVEILHLQEVQQMHNYQICNHYEP